MPVLPCAAQLTSAAWGSPRVSYIKRDSDKPCLEEDGQTSDPGLRGDSWGRCTCWLQILKELSVQAWIPRARRSPGRTMRQQEEFLARGIAPQGIRRPPSLGKTCPIPRDAEENCRDWTRISRDQARL